ncbi:hotdog family protein [Pectinatus sottacetonis]|uniref:3-hydroxyacyl-ACP dehydratase n=1 Tax=Pectinatus sottacetonis TaxID=1002795 RepID=UPI0018C45E86|nr:3-hydroxyacyl-ACP dehydratase [Pectinatus sottacetonis]
MMEIEKLLPQRPPFLFVDKIIKAQPNMIIGEKSYNGDNIFYSTIDGKKIIPSTILVESLMQCGGAGVKMLDLVDGNIMAVISIDKVIVKRMVAIPNTVIMQVENLRVHRKMLHQKGHVSLLGEAVLSAEWCCMAGKNNI